MAKRSAEVLKRISAMPTQAYWSTMGGVEVKSVEYDTDDYIVCISNAWWGSDKAVHRLKVMFSPSGREYVKLNGVRLYLDDCVRC